MTVTKEICKELTDREVIEKSLGNIDYFGCLYDRYEDKLLRYIRKISFASIEEADDILQEAFIKIWRNLHNYDKKLKFSSWVYRIVHNETISFCRKKRSFGKNNTVNSEDIDISDFSDHLAPVENQEDINLLTHHVLNKLKLKYREVLVLKYLENMSYEEISDVLKIPEGTVATRINRAKKMFKEMADRDHISFID